MQTLSLFDDPTDAAPLEAAPVSPVASAAAVQRQQAAVSTAATLDSWTEAMAARIFSDRKKGLKELQADPVRWTALVAAVGAIARAKTRSYRFARRGLPPEHTAEQLGELDRATVVIHGELLVSNDIPLFPEVTELEDGGAADDESAPRERDR